jgi:hypothetical protein
MAKHAALLSIWADEVLEQAKQKIGDQK